MNVQDLLGRINAKHGTEFKLKGRYAQGENQGAYAVEDALGAPLVLKWQPQPSMLSRLERACAVTDQLVTLAVPVPRPIPPHRHLSGRRNLLAANSAPRQSARQAEP